LNDFDFAFAGERLADFAVLFFAAFFSGTARHLL
jgi:hypothetical protein